jgi:type I restriction enzyme, S subunit
MVPESLLGVVPSGWAVSSLGEACAASGGDIQTGPFGSQLHASDYVENGVPSIMPQNIGDNRISEDGIARITESDALRLQRYRVRRGDIVYSRRGDVERRALIREREDGWLCGTGCLRVRFGDSRIDPRYAAYYLGHPAVRAWIVGHAQGATMPNLNTAILSELPFVIPPISEQRAIGSTLGVLDDRIEINRGMSATLEAMARALFKSWFVDFDPVRAKAEGRDPALAADIAALFPDSFENSGLGEIPKGWVPGSIDEIGNVTTGKRPLQRFSSKSGEHEVEVWGGNGPMAYTAEPLFREPILLTGRVGTLGSVFRISKPVWPSDNVLILKPKAPFFEFLFYSLREIDYSSLNRGSTQPLLTQGDLKAQGLVIPPQTIVERFSAVASTLFDRIDAANLESETLAALRDALLPKLVSGELGATDAKCAAEKSA